MKILNFIAPFTFLFFVACGGNQSGDMSEQVAPAQEMEMPYDGPNADLIAELDESTDMLLAAIDGLTPEQWVYQESPERWSIAGVAEHLVKSEGALRGMLVDSVLAGDPSMEMPDSTMEGDQAVRAMMADRSTAYPTTPPLEPTGMYATPQEAAAAFEAARDETVEFLKSTNTDLRAHSGSLAEGMAPMDGAQWVIFIASHVKRHIAQIEQVKAHEGYPSAM
ncbi:MAG TPA: DinB family protein [Rhodothermia bacterium]